MQQITVHCLLQLIVQPGYNAIALRQNTDKECRCDSRFSINPLQMSALMASTEVSDQLTHFPFAIPCHIILPFLLLPRVSSKLMIPLMP